MADISDVTALLAQTVLDACYPSGTQQASVTNADVFISEGFPLEGQLDPSIKAGKAAVTIYAAVGGAQNADQYLRRQEVISPAVLGLTLMVQDNVITFAGAPVPGEFVTVLLNNGAVLLNSAQITVLAILADLASQAVTAFPSLSHDGTTITFPGAYGVVARNGAKGLVGEILHREKSVVTVTIWAPNPADRTALANAIDITIKRGWRVTFPDTSQGFVRYSTTRISDERQNVSIYRRDLVYEVEYSTMDIYEAVTVLGVSTTTIN